MKRNKIIFFRLAALAVLTVACCQRGSTTGFVLYVLGLLSVAFAEENRDAINPGTAFSIAELPAMAGSHILLSVVLLPGMHSLLTICHVTSAALCAILLLCGAVVLPTAIVELFAWLDRRYDLSPLNLLRMSIRALRLSVRWLWRIMSLSAIALIRGVKGFVSGFCEVVKASRPTDDEGDEEDDDDDSDSDVGNGHPLETDMEIYSEQQNDKI